MAIMAASEPTIGELHHRTGIEKSGDRDEEYEQQDIAPPLVRVHGRRA
jgi:hypothetical protein